MTGSRFLTVVSTGGTALVMVRVGAHSKCRDGRTVTSPDLGPRYQGGLP